MIRFVKTKTFLCIVAGVAALAMFVAGGLSVQLGWIGDPNPDRNEYPTPQTTDDLNRWLIENRPAGWPTMTPEQLAPLSPGETWCDRIPETISNEELDFFWRRYAAAQWPGYAALDELCPDRQVK